MWFNKKKPIIEDKPEAENKEVAKPETTTLSSDDDCFSRARKILFICNVHGASALIGTIAEVLNMYEKLDQAKREQVSTNNTEDGK